MKRFRDILIGFLIGVILLSGFAYAAGTSIEVSFKPLKYYFDGVEKEPPADQKGFIYKGRTYVPLRFIGEALGEQVGWDGKTSSIYVGKQMKGSFDYIEDMETFTDGSSTSWKSVENYVTSNTGENYLHGLYSDFYDRIIDKEYLLNMDYEKFTALIIPSNHWSKEPKNEDIGYFEFYVDDKLVHKTGPIPSDLIKPMEINIDLEGALKFRIKGKGSNLGILEGKFIY